MEKSVGDCSVHGFILGQRYTVHKTTIVHTHTCSVILGQWYSTLFIKPPSAVLKFVVTIVFNSLSPVHSNKVSRTHSGGASNTSKHDDFRKNNNIKMAFPNDYTSVYPMNSSQGERANFSKKCDSPAPETCVRNTPIPVPPPTPPFKKTQSTSFSFEATPQTTPQYRTLTTPVHSDPNMKSELRTEEPITNQQRAAYGRNILARAPSIDASKNSKYSKTTLPVVAPHIRFGTHPEFVHVQGMEVGSSQC